MTRSDTYQLITDQFVEALEQGVVPWQKPWNVDTDLPRSLATRRPYRGINIFILMVAALARGYESPYWVTYKQAKKLGGQVRGGERGTQIVLWRRIDVEDKDRPGETKRIMLLKHFTVFNVEQCDGVKAPVTVTEEREFTPSERADAIVASYVERGPSLGHGGGRAFYRPSEDHVQMPRPETFDGDDAYYHTLFHELGHSTGHESRLARTFDRFGSGPYSREELVAEMTACFLASDAGTDMCFENSAAYIGHWIESIKDDPKAVVTAAGAAQRAADLILDRDAAVEGAPVEEPVAA